MRIVKKVFLLSFSSLIGFSVSGQSRVHSIIIPKKVLKDLTPDLSRCLPDIGNQNLGDCCAAFAAAWAMRTISVNSSRGIMRALPFEFSADPNWIFSPTYTFVVTKKFIPMKASDEKDPGIDLSKALESLKYYGSLTLQEFPMPNGDSPCGVDTMKILPSQIQKAKRRCILDDPTLVPSVPLFKNELSKFKSIGMSIFVPDNFYKLGESVPQNVPFKLNLKKELARRNNLGVLHAMVIVGYDSAIHSFKVLNSYGRNWGQDGCFYMDESNLFDDVVLANAKVGRTRIIKEFFEIDEKDPVNKAPGADALYPANADIEIDHYPFSKDTLLFPGQFEVFGDVKIGCGYISKKEQQKVLFYLVDNNTNQTLSTSVITEGEQIYVTTPTSKIMLTLSKIYHNYYFGDNAFFNVVITNPLGEDSLNTKADIFNDIKAELQQVQITLSTVGTVLQSGGINYSLNNAEFSPEIAMPAPSGEVSLSPSSLQLNQKDKKIKYFLDSSLSRIGL